jgi:hypothetical protein
VIAIAKTPSLNASSRDVEKPTSLAARWALPFHGSNAHGGHLD